MEKCGKEGMVWVSLDLEEEPAEACCSKHAAGRDTQIVVQVPEGGAQELLGSGRAPHCRGRHVAAGVLGALLIVASLVQVVALVRGLATLSLVHLVVALTVVAFFPFALMVSLLAPTLGRLLLNGGSLAALLLCQDTARLVLSLLALPSLPGPALMLLAYLGANITVVYGVLALAA